MIKLLFVCHGNICRSPMAQYVMQDLVDRYGLSSEFFIDSAATSREEIGSGVHRGTRRVLAKHAIVCGDHRARQLRAADAQDFDFIIGMDAANMRNMQRIVPSTEHKKLYQLLDWSDCPRDIADPWYTGDFERTFTDVREGCEALLAHLVHKA